jgi:hypothetical protein
VLVVDRLALDVAQLQKHVHSHFGVLLYSKKIVRFDRFDTLLARGGGPAALSAAVDSSWDLNF